MTNNSVLTNDHIKKINEITRYDLRIEKIVNREDGVQIHTKNIYVQMGKLIKVMKEMPELKIYDIEIMTTADGYLVFNFLMM